MQVRCINFAIFDQYLAIMWETIEARVLVTLSNANIKLYAVYVEPFDEDLE